LLGLITPPSGQNLIDSLYFNSSNLLYFMNNQIAIESSGLLGLTLQSLYSTSTFNITNVEQSDLTYATKV